MNSKYQRNPNILLREVAGEKMLVPVNDADLPADKLFMLNETGAYLWNLLDKPVTEISDNVRKDFSFGDSDDYEKDIVDFIKVLLEKGFINCIKSENEGET